MNTFLLAQQQRRGSEVSLHSASRRGWQLRGYRKHRVRAVLKGVEGSHHQQCYFRMPDSRGKPA